MRSSNVKKTNGYIIKSKSDKYKKPNNLHAKAPVLVEKQTPYEPQSPSTKNLSNKITSKIQKRTSIFYDYLNQNVFFPANFQLFFQNFLASNSIFNNQRVDKNLQQFQSLNWPPFYYDYRNDQFLNNENFWQSKTCKNSYFISNCLNQLWPRVIHQFDFSKNHPSRILEHRF